MIFDQEVYELILYNLIQNALKYNRPFDGDIVVTAEVRASRGSSNSEFVSEERKYILETQVINTG